MIDRNARHLLIIGAGGHAKVVIDVARAAGWVPVACFDPATVGDTCNGVPVVGGDDDVPRFLARGVRNAVVALGSNSLRAKVGLNLMSLACSCPPIIHPSAIVSPTAEVGVGAVIMPQVVVNAESSIGQFAILNTSCVVEHDCVIGFAAHIAPRASMGGNVRIGELALLGVGAVVRPHASIGDYAIVGSGSVVIGDVRPSVTVVGAPARPYRRPE